MDAFSARTMPFVAMRLIAPFSLPTVPEIEIAAECDRWPASIVIFPTPVVDTVDPEAWIMSSAAFIVTLPFPPDASISALILMLEPSRRSSLAVIRMSPLPDSLTQLQIVMGPLELIPIPPPEALTPTTSSILAIIRPPSFSI